MSSLQKSIMHRITSSELTTEHRHHKTIEEPDTSEKKEISTIVNEMQETIEINPYTNKPYSKNYYKILEKRMHLYIRGRKRLLRLLETTKLL